MKITLITPTYNSEKTLADTIQSIVAQKYSDLEYIIMDGASTDGTKNIVEQFRGSLDIRLVSERDKGIYDAMNKGVAMATGDVVGILNSDDFYCRNDVLAKVAGAFMQNPDIDGVYGDLQYVSPDNTKKVTRFWKSGPYAEKKLDSGWIIPHPVFFLKRSVYQKMDSVFNTSLPIAADNELLIRLLKIHKIKVHYIPERFVSMRTGGNSSESLSHRIKGWREMRRAWTINKLKVPRFFITRKVLGKISQFLKK